MLLKIHGVPPTTAYWINCPMDYWLWHLGRCLLKQKCPLLSTAYWTATGITAKMELETTGFG